MFSDFSRNHAVTWDKLDQFELTVDISDVSISQAPDKIRIGRLRAKSTLTLFSPKSFICQKLYSNRTAYIKTWEWYWPMFHLREIFRFVASVRGVLCVKKCSWTTDYWALSHIRVCSKYGGVLPLNVNNKIIIAVAPWPCWRRQWSVSGSGSPPLPHS